MTDEKELLKQLSILNEKMDKLGSNVRKYMESVNQEHYEKMLESRRSAIHERLLGQLGKDANEAIMRNIGAGCENKDGCVEFFKKMVGESYDTSGSRSYTDLEDKADKALLAIREKAPHKKCDSCVGEMTGMLEKQLRLMRSLNIYESSRGRETAPIGLDVSRIVGEFLEPLANVQRVIILKRLSTETSLFSELSRETGLNGGNLNFHLKKLMKSGFILQRHDRGDYMITEKGYSVLKIMTEMAALSEEGQLIF